MGLYIIDCVVCKKPFQWFSGNHHQVCPDCEMAIKMTNKKQAHSKSETRRLSAQGMECGVRQFAQTKCQRCGDLFYDPHAMIADAKQHATEWEDAYTKEKAAREKAEKENEILKREVMALEEALDGSIDGWREDSPLWKTLCLIRKEPYGLKIK